VASGGANFAGECSSSHPLSAEADRRLHPRRLTVEREEGSHLPTNGGIPLAVAEAVDPAAAAAACGMEASESEGAEGAGVEGEVLHRPPSRGGAAPRCDRFPRVLTVRDPVYPAACEGRGRRRGWHRGACPRGALCRPHPRSPVRFPNATMMRSWQCRRFAEKRERPWGWRLGANGSWGCSARPRPDVSGPRRESCPSDWATRSERSAAAGRACL